MAAVLFTESGCVYMHMGPSEKVMNHFVNRKDNQIMGLELLSISLGLCTFESILAGRKIVVHSDNTGSEVSEYHARKLVMRVSVCVRGRWH